MVHDSVPGVPEGAGTIVPQAIFGLTLIAQKKDDVLSDKIFEWGLTNGDNS